MNVSKGLFTYGTHRMSMAKLDTGHLIVRGKMESEVEWVEHG